MEPLARLRVLLSLALLLTVSWLAPGPRPAEAWLTRVDGTEHEDGDSGLTVTADPAGNVIVGGTLENEGTGADFAVLKLDATTGAEIWRHEVAGFYSALYLDVAHAVKTDAAGNVYAVGEASAMNSLIDLVAMKLDAATGAEVWRNDLSGAAGSGSYDVAQVLALAANGDLIIGGSMQDDPGFLNTDIALVRMSATDGSELWRVLEPGTSTGPDPGRGDYLRSVAVDAADDVVAGGYMIDDGPVAGQQYQDRVVLKVAGADGSGLWRYVQRDDGGSTFDLINAVAVDGTGDVFTVGQGQNGMLAQLIVAKLAGPTGNELWRVTGVIPGNTSSNDSGFGLALDANGDAIAVGGSGNGLAVVKLKGSDGTRLWRRIIPSTTSQDSLGMAVAVDANGDAIVSGTIDGHFAVVKIAGTDGGVLWQRQVPGTSGHAGVVTLDAAGNVAAAGAVDADLGTESDLTAVKLSNSTGAPVTCSNGTLDALEACDDGNLVDGDGCDSDCRLTVCAGGAAVSGLKLVLHKLVSGAGMQTLSAKGNLTFAPGTPAGYDPMTRGAQVLIEDLGTGGVVYDLSRRATPIPGSGAGVCTPRDGWRASHTRVVYRSYSGAIDPPVCTAHSALGLKSLKLVDHRSDRGFIQFVAKAVATSIAAPVGPLRVTIVLGAGEAESTSGACGQQAFATSGCTYTGNHATLACR